MHNLFWALLILFTTAVFLRIDWIYYLVYVIGGVWVFSHWWIRRSLDHLSVERKLSLRAFTGEKVDATIQLRNRSWLPLPWLQIQEQVPLDLKDQLEYQNVLSVAGRSQVDYHYKLWCKKRGYYSIGPLVLRTGDLFGFASASWQEVATVNMTVYPQVVPLQELGLSSRLPFGSLSSPHRLFDDPTRIAGVRDYISGDSMRSIHWKASAREDTLLVKKFQPAIALNVSIVLDLNRNAYPFAAVGPSEWAIVIAASFAAYVTQQRQPIGLFSNGLDPRSEEVAAPLAARNGEGQLMEILTLLARIQMHEYEHDLATWLPQQLANMAWGTTLILVTPALDAQSLWALHNTYRRGSKVFVLICAPQADFEDVRAQGKRLGVAVERTLWEKDLQLKI